MSERETNTTPAPQSGDVSADMLGSAPPSRSENAANRTAPQGALAHPRRDEAKGRESGASRGACTPASFSPPSRSKNAAAADRDALSGPDWLQAERNYLLAELTKIAWLSPWRSQAYHIAHRAIRGRRLT